MHSLASITKSGEKRDLRSSPLEASTSHERQKQTITGQSTELESRHNLSQLLSRLKAYLMDRHGSPHCHCGACQGVYLPLPMASASSASKLEESATISMGKICDRHVLAVGFPNYGSSAFILSSCSKIYTHFFSRSFAFSLRLGCQLVETNCM